MVLLDHVLVPVASDEDAHATCAALRPYLDAVERVTALHVIEKRPNAVDKAPVEKRREDAAAFLGIVEATLGDVVGVDTRTAFGTDVVETVFEEAVDADATAVAFRPRGGGRLARLLAGDTATRLVTAPPRPVLALPEAETEVA